MKKRYKFLTVILVVALMLSLSATVAADYYYEFNYTFTQPYSGKYFEEVFYISFTPGNENTNSVAYCTVNVANATDGLAVTTITDKRMLKTTARGTTVSNNWVASGLAGIREEESNVYQIDYFGARTYNGTIYNYNILCY